MLATAHTNAETGGGRCAARRKIEFQELPVRQRKRNPPAPSAGTENVESARRLVPRSAPMTTRRHLPEL